MDILVTVLVILHLIGMAYLLGAVLVQLKDIIKGEGRILRGILDGSLLQLITGVVLVGLFSVPGLVPGEEETPDNAVVGIKLVLALVIYVFAFINRNNNPTKSWILWLIGAFTLVNVVLGVTSVMH